MKKALLVTSLAVIMTVGCADVQAKTVKNTNVQCAFNNKVKDKFKRIVYNYKKAPDVVESRYIHGYLFPQNYLKIRWKKIKYAKNYSVVISKDNKFKHTKTYTTKNDYLYISSNKDKFVTENEHGKYAKVRANFVYGHTNWSKAYPIGCDRLHINKR